MEGNIMSVCKNKAWKKKEKGKQYHFSFIIKAAGKNIKLGRGEGDENFGEENKDFKKGGGGAGKNIKMWGTL